MLPIQPPCIPKYFDFSRKVKTPHNAHLFSRFCLSWEDGLWHVLKVHAIPKGSVVLVPSFFCWDVVKNMQQHGLVHKVYAVDKNLQPIEAEFIAQLKQWKPAVVIIFHSVGITNNLFKNPSKWLPFVSIDALIIEDSVHRVVDSSRISFITKNHYVIDSLRKVVPIQGSWMYAGHRIPKIPVSVSVRTVWYRVLILFWWLVMQFFLVLVYYSRASSIEKKGNTLAELAMLRGYEAVGVHLQPSPGHSIMAFLSRKIALQKNFSIKKKQALRYAERLQSCADSKNFFFISMQASDAQELRVFPLGIELRVADDFLAYLREHTLSVRFELNDSIWSSRQKIVYLPMGLHVQDTEIDSVCAIILQYGKS